MKILLSIVFAAFAAPTFGQTGIVNPEKKTIEVIIAESAEMTADVAVIRFGYENKATTKDAAYKANLDAAAKIMAALRSVKVPLDGLETSKLTVGTTFDENSKKEFYVAVQNWSLRLASPDAATVVDLLLKAGANRVEHIEWEVADTFELRAKGTSAALEKARLLGERMAKAAGKKLGELLEISNMPHQFDELIPQMVAYKRPMLAGFRGAAPLELFAKKVREEVKVRVVFALE